MLVMGSVGGRRATRSGLTLAASLVVAGLLAAAAVPAPALAAPTGEYAEFWDCPATTVEACIQATTSSGEFTVGKKTVPIKSPITLQGGWNEGEGEDLVISGAKDGDTLSKTPQVVPGGLTGIQGLVGEVTATTELAAPASSIILNEGNLLGGEGIALVLPIKIKLSNAFLGTKCYVGSNAHPIVLELTTGGTAPPKPNKPIAGREGVATFNGSGTILTIANNSLVDNSFAVPGAEGCGSSPTVVDQLIDQAMGVPSSAGHNTAILDGTLKQGGAEAVEESE